VIVHSLLVTLLDFDKGLAESLDVNGHSDRSNWLLIKIGAVLVVIPNNSKAPKQQEKDKEKGSIRLLSSLRFYRGLLSSLQRDLTAPLHRLLLTWNHLPQLDSACLPG
jgi:hypothetical protein